MTDDSELSYVMDVGKPCVDLYARFIIERMTETEGGENEKRTGVKGKRGKKQK